MVRLRLAVLIAAILIQPGRAHAQATLPPRSPGTGQVHVDVSKLPIDVQRIVRVIEAQQASERANTQDPFHLRYYVQVYGQAPQVDLLQNFDTKSGPVPFSAPTHQDFLNLVTPKEYRAMSYGGINMQQLIDWLQKHISKKSDSSRP